MAKKEHSEETPTEGTTTAPAVTKEPYAGDPFNPSEELIRQIIGTLDGDGRTPAVEAWVTEIKRRTAGRW